MRIGIDGRPLGGDRAGIGRYVLELSRALDPLLPSAQFFVYSPCPIEPPLRSARWVIRVDSSWAARMLKPVLWLKLRADALCRDDELDVFWATGAFLPRVGPRVRRVMTVYDLNARVVPETMGATHLIAHKLFFARDLAASDAVVAISEGTAARLKEHFGYTAAAIVRPGVSAFFRPPLAGDVEAALQSLGIDRPYFLSVATPEPRKNLELLVDAFLSLKGEGALPGYELILVGGKGWGNARLRALLECGRDAGVRAVGYVADELLPALYAGCQSFVFPSVYEGFGMPVLEARACGAHVIATDLPELREAGGTQTTYIAPTREGLRGGLLASARTARYTAEDPTPLPSWSDAARRFVAVLTPNEPHPF